jgi:hypothetical protein
MTRASAARHPRAKTPRNLKRNLALKAPSGHEVAGLSPTITTWGI